MQCGKILTYAYSTGLILIMLLNEQPAHEKIGVVDSQWIVHQTVPSLGNQVYPRFSLCFLSYYVISLALKVIFFQQGQAEKGKAPWEGVCCYI